MELTENKTRFKLSFAGRMTSYRAGICNATPSTESKKIIEKRKNRLISIRTWSYAKNEKNRGRTNYTLILTNYFLSRKCFSSHDAAVTFHIRRGNVIFPNGNQQIIR